MYYVWHPPGWRRLLPWGAGSRSVVIHFGGSGLYSVSLRKGTEKPGSKGVVSESSG